MWRMGFRFGGLLLVTACVSLPQPTPVDVTRAQQKYPNTTLVSLSEARKTYVTTCSGCHALHLPREFPPPQWPALVTEMETVQKVRLTAAQRQQIEEFLVVMSETSSVRAQ
jgi:hypothetical protein